MMIFYFYFSFSPLQSDFIRFSLISLFFCKLIARRCGSIVIIHPDAIKINCVLSWSLIERLRPSTASRVIVIAQRAVPAALVLLIHHRRHPAAAAVVIGLNASMLSYTAAPNASLSFFMAAANKICWIQSLIRPRPQSWLTDGLLVISKTTIKRLMQQVLLRLWRPSDHGIMHQLSIDVMIGSGRHTSNHVILVKLIN